MFPNLRLLIGALFASVVALCCGFGVFAAYRVNHQPVGRLPTDTAALQLVVDQRARPAQTWGVPLRVQTADRRSGRAELKAAAPPVRSTAVELPNLVTPPAVRIDAVDRLPEQSAHAPVPSAAAPISVPAPSHTQSRAALAAPPAPTPATSAAASPPAAPVSAPAEHAAAATPPAALASPPAEHSAAPATIPEPAPAVTRDAAERSPQTPNVAVASTVATAPAPNAAPPAPPSAAIGKMHIHPKARGMIRPVRKIARKPAEPHRVVARRRVVRKTPAAAAAQFGGQNSNFEEPVFRSAPTFWQQPPARTRATKEPVKDGASANAFAWPNVH